MTAELLTLNLELESPIVKVDEPLTAHLTLHNQGDRPVLVNQRFVLNASAVPKQYRDVIFTITNEQHETLNFMARVRVGEVADKDFGILEPNQQLEFSYNLTNYFEFDTPGIYTLTATYANETNPSNGQAFQGVITSNSVQVELIP